MLYSVYSIRETADGSRKKLDAHDAIKETPKYRELKKEKEIEVMNWCVT